jgi:predicted Ser/Thr protein kinase
MDGMTIHGGHDARDDDDPPRVDRSGPRLQTHELDALLDDALPRPAEQRPRGAEDPYIGLLVDHRYEIEALIAVGGMGLVYRCRHSVLGKKLAIKIIRADVAQTPDGSQRFLLEAKSASSIGNEHIVDISDFGALPDGSPYLVMELLEGVPLTQLTQGKRRLEPERIITIARQIAVGLGAAHAAGIVHRDLKPDNLLVLERKGEDFVKILDFGVARMTESAKKLTQVGTIIGTPHYMSPEQAMGEEVDARGDIYSLGIILYELCAGRVPFDGEHYLAVLNQHRNAKPPLFASLEPPVGDPAALERVILRCLEKSRERRYASMAELHAELGGVLRSLSVGGAPRAAQAPVASCDEVPGVEVISKGAGDQTAPEGVRTRTEQVDARPVEAAPRSAGRGEPTLVLSRPDDLVPAAYRRWVTAVALAAAFTTGLWGALSVHSTENVPRAPALASGGESPGAAVSLHAGELPAAASARPVEPSVVVDAQPAAELAPKAAPSPPAEPPLRNVARKRPAPAAEPRTKRTAPPREQEFMNPWPAPR